MRDDAVTRRTLLLAGAGALAGAAVTPPLARASQPRGPRLASWDLGRLGPQARTVALPAGVQLVGLRWRSPQPAHPQLRVRLADGRWGPWTDAGSHGHGPDGRDAGADAGARAARQIQGEPLWAGGSRTLQLRSSTPLGGAVLQLVLAGRGEDARAAMAGTLPLAQPVLAAGAGQPAIIARSAWARGVPLPRVAPAYGEVKLGFVHHTENPNGYAPWQVPAMLRAIYLFHREGNGWNDIGYNFVIDLFGRVWEARAGGIDEAVVGAQAGGYNLVSSGVAVLGSFSGTPISPAALRTLQRLLAWKLSLHGVPARGRVSVRVNPAGASYSKYPARAHVSLARIAGHRDADSTNCPGDGLYAELPGVRRRVVALSGSRAVRVTLALQPAPAPLPVPPEGAAATPPPSPAQPPQLAVALARLDGTPLGGAQVQLQARTVSRRGLSVSHAAVAEGVTDAAGRWLTSASFALGAPAPLWVRALYAGGPGGGAGVSTAVQVAPLPAPAPPAPTQSPASAPTS